MHTITSHNKKYSLLDAITVTSLFVALMKKLPSSVKEFTQISVSAILLFPNQITFGDTVFYQKSWEGGIPRKEMCLTHIWPQFSLPLQDEYY